MAKEIIEEQKSSNASSRKMLENVPVLAWGRGRECTYAGALEAALAVTEHPYSYSDIMGFTGLAFRTRWWKPAGEIKWCPSCAVGEMREEITAAAKSTGWHLKCEVSMEESFKENSIPKIVESINSGKPVLAYDDKLNVAVIYGYDEAGKKLLFRDYDKGEKIHELPASKLGWMVIYPGEYDREVSQKEAVIESLKIAVYNWRREIGQLDQGRILVWKDRTLKNGEMTSLRLAHSRKKIRENCFL